MFVSFTVSGNAVQNIKLSGLPTDKEITVKIMVWDSAENMIPLMKAATFTKAQSNQ